MPDKTILLVEDNPDDEALTIHALRQETFVDEVIVIRDGEAAVEYLTGNGKNGDGKNGNGQHKKLPSLVLLDIKLPKLDGLEVLRRIRADESSRLLPVVMLTSSSEQRDLIESYRLGTNSYIQKPVNFDDFLKAAHQLGVYWLQLNKSAI